MRKIIDFLALITYLCFVVLGITFFYKKNYELFLLVLVFLALCEIRSDLKDLLEEYKRRLKWQTERLLII